NDRHLTRPRPGQQLRGLLEHLGTVGIQRRIRHVIRLGKVDHDQGLLASQAQGEAKTGLQQPRMVHGTHTFSPEPISAKRAERIWQLMTARAQSASRALNASISSW